MDSDEERNYYRLLLLLLRVGTPKLREFFIRKWNSAAGHRPWYDCPQDGADLTVMWKPKIHHYENAKVTSGDTSTWDLSLFVRILSPNEPRRGICRALDKLKDLRNSLCHSYEAKLSNHDFQGQWNDACNALILFGAKPEDFKSVKKDAKQPLEDLKPVVVKWLAHEFELLHNGQLQLLQKLEKVKEGQLTLYDKIQQCQNVILEKICELKEMQHATAGGTNEPELKQPDTDANQSTSCEGKELLKYLKGYYRTGERAVLLPFSWMEGDQYHIENIYTTTKIVEMNTNHVTSLDGIFVEAATDLNNIRRILIEGEPGIGKSAICKKIAYDWSMDKLFPAFEVVLSLKCRDFHNASGLWDAIEQIFSDGLKEMRNHDTFNEYIENNQSKVLLVLDGYDEIPDKCADTMKQSIERLIRGQLLPDCSVIVTSRPGKGSGIRNDFDRKLEIKGFEVNDSIMFIKRFFVPSPATSEAAVSFIKRCEAAKDLVRNPFNTAILCLQKKNNEELSIPILTKDISFSITKRYCMEKLGQDVNDDDIASVVQEKLYKPGKMAFIMTTSNRGNEVEENELRNTVNSTGLIAFLVAFLYGINSWIRKIFHKESLGDKVNDNNLMMEFLVYEQPVNTIRTTPFYTFPHASLKEHLAVDYVKESVSKNYYMEWMCILPFKNWATFLRVIRFIHVVLKRCLEDKSLKWVDIIVYLASNLMIVIHFGNNAYRNWNH